MTIESKEKDMLETCKEILALIQTATDGSSNERSKTAWADAKQLAGKLADVNSALDLKIKHDLESSMREIRNSVVKMLEQEHGFLESVKRADSAIAALRGYVSSNCSSRDLKRDVEHVKALLEFEVETTRKIRDLAHHLEDESRTVQKE